MNLRTFFPRWYSQSCLTPKEWASIHTLGDDGQYSNLLALILRDQQLASQISRAKLFTLSEAVAKDIIFLQAPFCSKRYHQNLEFLQFEVSVVPLVNSINSGEFHIAHDWILNGFDNHISDGIEREFNSGRIFAFLASDASWIEDNRTEHLLDWFGYFYYYCRARAALYDVASGLVPIALSLLRSSNCPSGIFLNTATFLLSWCDVYKHEAVENLAPRLLKIYDSTWIGLEAKARIAVCFASLSKRVGDREPIFWAKWALENAKTELHGHEPLQLIIATITTGEEWRALKSSVIRAIDAYILDLRVALRSPSAAILGIDQRVQLLNPLVWKLQSFGCGTDLLEVLCHWYAVPTALRRLSGVLFAFPTVHEGMTYLGTARHCLPHLHSNSIESLNVCTNESLGIATTLLGQKEYKKAPDRLGEPAYGFGMAFEQELVKHYQWDKLPEAELREARAMLVWPGYSHPNQALLQAQAGHCLPIASSLQQPLRDAEINNVGIWFAGDDFYSEMEAHAISAVLETAGITSAIVSGRGKTKDEFLDFYNHADFDLIWIAGHGICDRWDPKSPAILAGDAGEIEMDLLVPKLTRPSRRLLVLNICDGGTSTLTGGIQKLGLAPMLASQHQATLSHLWPVEPRVAAAFGVLLATELAQSRDDFFGAFKAAINAFREPWAAIVERIAKQYEGDLVDRLRNCEHDMRNIFHWGSPCFFE